MALLGDGGKELSVKAHVSTTWLPCVLITFMVWPAERGTAIPWRAGMVVNWEVIMDGYGV